MTEKLLKDVVNGKIVYINAMNTEMITDLCTDTEEEKARHEAVESSEIK